MKIITHCIFFNDYPGKTAAFLVPILERLLFRSKKTPAVRVLILVPTRELGMQCHQVAKRLCSHTDIEVCLCVGM